MKLHELDQPNAKRTTKRLGRGIGSGVGKTSGKGHKGQNARSGGGVRPGFEGGQMPLIRRLPKRGFTNIWRKKYTVVNVSLFEEFPANTVITVEFLKTERKISKIEKYGLKVIGNGKLTKPYVVKASKFSDAAAQKIVKAGGSYEVI